MDKIKGKLSNSSDVNKAVEMTGKFLQGFWKTYASNEQWNCTFGNLSTVTFLSLLCKPMLISVFSNTVAKQFYGSFN